MAGIILRAPDGSIMVTLTILSKTEGGPSFNDEDTAVDGAAAAAMLRRTEGATDRRATLLRQEESMVVGADDDVFVGLLSFLGLELI
mmetsp:Transcript_7014/g.11447  ORF Transcript_7014/g.11447 Transcript_7014/m.11447 type:complete len:87 (+) Transcript_7014:429-689(+)